VTQLSRLPSTSKTRPQSKKSPLTPPHSHGAGAGVAAVARWFSVLGFFCRPNDIDLSVPAWGYIYVYGGWGFNKCKPSPPQLKIPIRQYTHTYKHIFNTIYSTHTHTHTHAHTHTHTQHTHNTHTHIPINDVYIYSIFQRHQADLGLLVSAIGAQQRHRPDHFSFATPRPRQVVRGEWLP